MSADLHLLIEQLHALNDPGVPKESRLNNMIAALYWSDPNISWAGIYKADSDSGTTWLSSFQGKPACMMIPAHHGVIGACLDQKKTMVVSNVHEFPGHIACDSASKSEIVLPLYMDGQIHAVLDLDSDVFSHFDHWSVDFTKALQSEFESVLD